MSYSYFTFFTFDGHRSERDELQNCVLVDKCVGVCVLGSIKSNASPFSTEQTIMK